ncbi:F-box domain [Dillenia turbinata]|uniref:F-box domain n=1 Tax=Dillenia turbinata TaxID=194707 RepID=A0AAN8YWK6_9MAGN
MGRMWIRFYESLLAPSTREYNEILGKGLDLKSSRDLDEELACELAAKLEGDSEQLACYDFFSLLPDDVPMVVLVRLPVGCVFTCRMVCRRWRILTSSPDFLRLHCRYKHKENSGFFVIKAEEHEVLDNEVQGCYIEEDWTIKTVHERLTRNLQPGFHVLYGSCNGLLLFTVNGTPPYICFWNPTTQERLLFELPADGSSVCGFFFHELTEDYRVLCVYKEENYFQYMMLSLRTRCWRKISGFTSHPYLPIAPIHADGALYWLVARNVSCGTEVNCDEMIMLYDIDKDEFCTKNHPHHEPCGSAWHSFMWIEERSFVSKN